MYTILKWDASTNFKNTNYDAKFAYCMIAYDFKGTDSALNGIAHFLETPEYAIKFITLLFSIVKSREKRTSVRYQSCHTEVI